MDRLLTKEEKQKEKRGNFLKWGIAALFIILAVTVVMLMAGNDLKSENLLFGEVDRGEIESSISASGKVDPLYEVIMVSPVSTRIMEIYTNEGDSVEKGESLLRLDLQTAESELRKASDQVSMKRNEFEETILSQTTHLTDLEMKIKTKEMSLNHLEAEVDNERRLDSIGSGTGDRIREAELAYETGKLELAQMKMQFENEKKAQNATIRNKRLEGEISQRDLEAVRRRLDDARIKSPISGIVTYLNKSIGASISSGEKLAVVSDLTKFKISGKVPESYSVRLSVGSVVKVRIGNNVIPGYVSTISPQSSSGMVDFSVRLENESEPVLRSGLRAELNVVYDVKENVVRIPAGGYFQGPGHYRLFVKIPGNRLERRDVTLGDSNFDYVEVVDGLKEGETVVINDMKEYENRSVIGLK